MKLLSKGDVTPRGEFVLKLGGLLYSGPARVRALSTRRSKGGESEISGRSLKGVLMYILQHVRLGVDTHGTMDHFIRRHKKVGCLIKIIWEIPLPWTNRLERRFYISVLDYLELSEC
jgi:hypothetical protein